MRTELQQAADASIWFWADPNEETLAELREFREFWRDYANEGMSWCILQAMDKQDHRFMDPFWGDLLRISLNKV